MWQSMLTVDVEEWYNILDSACVPPVARWATLESRLEGQLAVILEMLERSGQKATFFWLGWHAERHPGLARRCSEAGHEVASHGYAHVLAYEVGPQAFAEDALRARQVLEGIVGREVLGFRAAGFSVLDGTDWFYEQVCACGYTYDSSVFPSRRGHGGMRSGGLDPYVVHTSSGDLLEVPQSMLSLPGVRFSVFGGGYLRIAPRFLIRLAVRHLRRHDRPLVVYVHPREIDPGHPRLPLPFLRRVKCYTGLGTTRGKLAWLLARYGSETMGSYAQRFGRE